MHAITSIDISGFLGSLLGFLSSESSLSAYSPGKEIQPFGLSLVLNRLARLGFRKLNRPILSERNVRRHGAHGDT